MCVTNVRCLFETAGVFCNVWCIFVTFGVFCNVQSCYIKLGVHFYRPMCVHNNCTVVGDYIKIMKTTFNFKFNLYQAFKQHGYTKHGKKEKLLNKTYSL